MHLNFLGVIILCFFLLGPDYLRSSYEAEVVSEDNLRLVSNLHLRSAGIEW
jgi:hypothetical protein